MAKEKKLLRSSARHMTRESSDGRAKPPQKGIIGFWRQARLDPPIGWRLHSLHTHAHPTSTSRLTRLLPSPYHGNTNHDDETTYPSRYTKQWRLSEVAKRLSLVPLNDYSWYRWRSLFLSSTFDERVATHQAQAALNAKLGHQWPSIHPSIPASSKKVWECCCLSVPVPVPAEVCRKIG